MANLKEIRQRVSTVRSTRQITSAMKMVSAAKLKKAQDAIIRIRPYEAALHHILDVITLSSAEAESSPLTVQRTPDRVLLVVITANRGLCGGFNLNVAREAIDIINSDYPGKIKSGQLDLLVIGKKGAEIIRSKGYGQWPVESHLVEKPSYLASEELAAGLINQFLAGQYDRIELIYNQFKNAATQILIREQFLPVEPVEPPANTRGNAPFYIFEPDLNHLATALLPKALKIRFHKAILDSQAAEHGARMTAMHQATDNATEMIRGLTLEYNKARQAAITGELIEIVSGAEALKS
ncbi:MAG: ATP synthase F1 subunit gamma [Bacteroidales bacterium]